MTRRTLTMEMNRVEGDLEIRIQVDDHVVTDAWCVGTMYRGFEQILVGRAPGDALVITPRICGICSTSQLYASVTALETAAGAPVAPNGTRIRNLCLMAEAVMNDARHTFLVFAPDLCHARYREQPLYPKILEAFEPTFRGRIAREAVLNSKRILAIVIAFGGQWPHSTYMLPGGVTAPLDGARLDECLAAIDAYAAWYERDVLGCPLDRWLALSTPDELWAWLDEAEAHRDSAAGLFLRFGRAIGLHQTGRGVQNLLSAGCYLDPERWQPPFAERPCLSPGGFLDGATGRVEPFDHTGVAEDVAHSWYADAGGPRHPWEAATKVEQRDDGDRYSFGKAPRYRDRVAQLGPLSDLVLGGDRLMGALYAAEGPSTWLRQLARLHRPAGLLRAMRALVEELRAHLGEPTCIRCEMPKEGRGVGLVNAARGTLGHWVEVQGGKIANYQVITPTTWNGSPRDGAGRRGHWEESFIGLEIADLDDPVELSHVVRSHDACLVCTVHFVGGGRRTWEPW
jgi:Ni,Fe-hydrogenase I large subunit